MPSPDYRRLDAAILAVYCPGMSVPEVRCAIIDKGLWPRRAAMPQERTIRQQMRYLAGSLLDTTTND